MPRTQPDITAQMRALLAISEPDLDTTVGSTTRKILDVVGEVVAEAYADRFLIGYQYDIDSRSGADLDDFVALFGFSRLPAKRATGTVVFERPASSLLGTIMIPMGTQVGTLDMPTVIFQTTVTAILDAGVSLVEIPVRAVLGGPNGNVTASAIRQWITPITGLASFSNPVGTTGGTSRESDEDLRNRFKRTVFRGLAGTEQMFVGLALEDDDVERVNVVGASKRRHEQIELVAGFGASTVEDAVYVYEKSAIFGPDLVTGNIMREGVHYSFNPTGGPSVTSLDNTLVPDGIYQLEFEYVPYASRNDVSAGITNRIDIYVNGVREVEAAETLVYTEARPFTNTPTDPFYNLNFIREDGSNPRIGNFLLPYSFSPVTNPSSQVGAPNTIVINSTTYTRGVNYFLVNDISPNGMSPRSYSGIEWVSNANGASPANPSVGLLFPVTYRYNEIPLALESSIDRWRLVTTDVQVHQARFVRLNLFMAAIFDEGYAPSAVEPALFTALADFIQRVDFDASLQISDLLSVAHAVPGVDAIRFLTSDDDAVHYAIQQVADNGTTLLRTFSVGVSPARATDLILGDNEIPVLNDLTVIPKAQNSWGTV
jgi:hypothetical protein